MRKKTRNGSYSRFYAAGNGLLNRCLVASHPSYDRYGGRGIKVYKPWINEASVIAEYLEDLWFKQFGHNDYSKYGTGSDQYSLDRIDNNGNYVPGNLRFATKQEQCANTAKNYGVKEGQNEKTTI